MSTWLMVLAKTKSKSSLLSLPVWLQDKQGHQLSMSTWYWLRTVYCIYLCGFRINQVISWPNDGAVELAEDNRFLWHWCSLLLTVVTVVHPHTENLLWVCDRCQKLDILPLQHKVSTVY